MAKRIPKGLARYNRLKSEYKRKHGQNPPKGTGLADLERILNKKSTSRSSRSSSKRGHKRRFWKYL